MRRSLQWRIPFLVCGVLILVGGPRHPEGDMAHMLADPAWVPAHLLMLGGFIAFLLGLLAFSRGGLPERTRRWTRRALVGAGLMVLEMALHTAATVDAARYAAGQATPVFWAHIALILIAYPIFGLVVTGWILATSGDRVLGSAWIGWIGIVGAVATGLAPYLIWLGINIFAMMILFAAWTILAAVWPVRAGAPRPAEAAG